MEPIARNAGPLAFAVILGLAFIGYGQLLRPGWVPYSKHSDIVAAHLATKTALHRSYRLGRGLPFWRNDQMSGLPALTNPQSQYTYPLHALFHVLRPLDAIGPTFWLHFLVGALVLYLVGRALELGRWACLFMATAQLFSFKLIAIVYAGFLPVVPTVTLFPLLFASIFRLMRKPDLKAMLALAASGAICLSTCGFQLLYYAAIFLASYLLWEAVVRWRGGRAALTLKTTALILSAALLSVGIMAHLVIPLLAESSLLSRQGLNYEFLLSGYTFTLNHLSNFLYAESLGSLADASDVDRYLWEDVIYFGIIPLGLALVGTVCGWRRRHTPFLIFGFVLSLLLAMDTPLLRALYHTFPGFGLFRMPIRFVYFTGFFGIVLAGVGIEEIVARLRSSATPRHALMGYALPVVLLLLMSAEGTFYAHRYIKTVRADWVLPETDYAAFFDADEEVYRVAPLLRYSIQPGWSSPLGLQLVTGYLPYNLAHYQSFFGILQSGGVEAKGAHAYIWADLWSVARWDLLSVLNVKYVVSYAPMDQPQKVGYRQVAHFTSQPLFVFFEGMATGDIYIYQNENFIDRAFWVRQMVTARDEEEMIRAVQRSNLQTTAVVFRDATRAVGASAFNERTGDRVAVVESADGHLVLETHSQESRFLTISEVWHPGWQGSLDGMPLQLERCNLALIGAWIPEGDHRVVLRFRPLHWPLAVGISGASLMAFCALLAVCYSGVRPDRTSSTI